MRVSDQCVELFKQNFSEKIIFSGNVGRWTKDFLQTSEAEFFKENAVKKGVPETNIILEKKSTNFGENCLYTQALLNNENLLPNHLIVVTKPNSERRLLATIRKVWPELKITITSPKMNFLEQIEGEYCNFDSLIHEMVGDLQRMMVYPDLGYQIVQEVPEEIYAIYNKLIELGYSKELLWAR